MKSTIPLRPSRVGHRRRETTPEADYRARRLAFYEACVNGWVQTSFEKDKSILTIASGALAIVFGVIFQFAANIPLPALVCFAISGVGFGASVLVCVAIFAKNRAVFESNIGDGPEISLRHLDLALNFFFIVAVIALMAGGGWMAGGEFLRRINHDPEANRAEDFHRRQRERPAPPRPAAIDPTSNGDQARAVNGDSDHAEKGLEIPMSDESKSPARRAIEAELIKSATGLKNLAPTPPQGSNATSQSTQGAAAAGTSQGASGTGTAASIPKVK